MNRRHVLIGTGTLLSATLAGCVDDADLDSPAGDTDPKNDTDPNNDKSRDDPSKPDDDGSTDGDVRSIDGRLHNETDDTQTFQISISEESGDEVIEGEEIVGPNTTRRLPAFGRPGATQTVDVTVGGVSATETLDLDVESTEGALDGYVEIRFTGSETIEIEFTPRSEFVDDRDVVTEQPRVDSPPHDIERPDPPEDPADFDEWDDEYLGASMATEPSLEFTRHDGRLTVFADRGVNYHHDEAYWVEVIESTAALEDIVVDEDLLADLAGVDFDETVLVAVETGFGSGSVDHRWARAVDVSDGIHLHGYYTDPYEATDDITTWGSVLEVERPEGDVDLARVSLTVDEDRRVHFNSTEGIVTTLE